VSDRVTNVGRQLSDDVRRLVLADAVLRGIESLARRVHWGSGMWHIVSRTADHRLAFSTWGEGVRLWNTVWRVVPSASAVCVMPDHIHVLAGRDVRARLGVALGGYARWRNARRRARGRLWAPVPEAVPVGSSTKQRRSVRYIHLNPCRGGLVDDPLAWPLSSHVDRVGLVVRPRCRRASRPDRFHAFVSSDPSVDLAGTALPAVTTGGPLPASTVLDAVSVAMRVPRQQLFRRGDRELAARALGVLTDANTVQIASVLRCGREWVSRLPRTPSPAVSLVERWAGDPRCIPLDDEELRRMLARSRYRRLPA